MCSAGSDWTCLQPGFPIRKSSDQSLVIDSPRLIADSYVLLRFLVPRHPPCALINLSHKDARVHCVVLKIRAALIDRGACRSVAVVRPADQVLPCKHGLEVQAFARALRTQQRVRHRCRPRSLSTARRLVLADVIVTVPNNRCSTLEHLLPDIR